MRMKSDFKIYDKNQEFKFKTFPKNYSNKNRQTGVKYGINHNNRQDISKLNKRHYRLQENITFNT